MSRQNTLTDTEENKYLRIAGTWWIASKEREKKTE